jgi:hypothetical protein
MTSLKFEQVKLYDNATEHTESHDEPAVLSPCVLTTQHVNAGRHSADTNSWLADHVLIFPPPELSHEDDVDSDYETILLDTIILPLVTYDKSGIIDPVIMIATLRTVRDSFCTVNAVGERELGNALRDLSKKGITKDLSCDAEEGRL